MLSLSLFRTLSHHSSWNVLEEINAARTQMPTLIGLRDAVSMKFTKHNASLYQITSLLFMNMEKEKKKKKGKKKIPLWLQGVIIKTYNRRTDNSVLVIWLYERCMILWW